MIKDLYKKTHEVTVKGIKKATDIARTVTRKDEKIITLGDILKLYPNGRVFLNDSDGKPIYDFNMENPNVLFQNLDKRVEKIEIAMFPSTKTHRGELCLSINLK